MSNNSFLKGIQYISMHNDNSIALCIYQLINKVYLYMVPFVLKHVVKLDIGKQGINVDT